MAFATQVQGHLLPPAPAAERVVLHRLRVAGLGRPEPAALPGVRARRRQPLPARPHRLDRAPALRHLQRLVGGDCEHGDRAFPSVGVLQQQDLLQDKVRICTWITCRSIFSKYSKL